MNKSEKKLAICFRVVSGSELSNNKGWGATFSFGPVASSNLSDSVDVDIIVSYPGSKMQVNSFRNLAEFDFNVSYENAVPNFLPYISLNRDSIEAANWRLDTFRNIIDFSEISYFREFRFRSAKSQATVSFIGCGVEEGALSFSNTASDDDKRGNSLCASLNSDVTEISEPAVSTLPSEDNRIGFTGFRNKVRDILLPQAPGPAYHQRHPAYSL